MVFLWFSGGYDRVKGEGEKSCLGLVLEIYHLGPACLFSLSSPICRRESHDLFLEGSQGACHYDTVGVFGLFFFLLTIKNPAIDISVLTNSRGGGGGGKACYICT